MPTWAKQKNWIYFTKKINNSTEIFRANFECEVEQLTTTAGSAAISRYHPSMSSDDQFLVYTQFEGGGRNLVVLNLDSLEESQVTSYDFGQGAAWPQWRPFVP